MAKARIATADPDADRVAAVRSFNRFYTQHLGVLRSAWLDSPFSLTQARVLYEIRQREGATATDIARDLDLDAGYLSRILRRFGRDGLIAREASSQDARASHLSLTAKGRKAFAPLEQRTVRQATDILAGLPTADRERLVASMRTIERLIAPAPREQAAITLRQPRPGDLGWIVQRHAEVYLAEQGWADNFEGVCAGIVAEFAKGHDPATERCWIADMGGHSVGSVFLVRDTAAKSRERTARLRLLLVDPLARGRGLGKRLTEESISFARAAGYRRLTLWTHRQLTAARHIYASAGFTLTSAKAMRNFGQDVVSEHWDLVL